MSEKAQCPECKETGGHGIFCSRKPRNEFGSLRPYIAPGDAKPLSNGPVTHWEECWKDSGHWRCAQERIATRERQLAGAQRALEAQHAGTDAVWNQKAEVMAQLAAMREAGKFPVVDQMSWFYKNCRRQRASAAKICQVCPFRKGIESQERKAAGDGG